VVLLGLISTIFEVLWTGLVSKFSKPLGTVAIGEYTYGKPKILGLSKDNVLVIGKYCSIGYDVTFIGIGGQHTYKHIANFPLFSQTNYSPNWSQIEECRGAPTIIGNDVWIGKGATIMPKVKVGDGAVVGACALVTKDVPPYTVVGGVPAKIIRRRFTEKQIEALLKIAWWNWDRKKIIDNIAFFYSDVDDFIRRFS
jgi:acetyltransferase-like isoleucine patch superfamily enzyme